MIENQLREILISDTAVWSQVGERIVPIERDLDAAIPAIVYTSEEPERNRRIDNTFSPIIKQDIEFEILHNSYDDAKLLARRLCKVLDNFAGESGDYFIHMIRTGGQGEDKEKDVGVVMIRAHVIYEQSEEEG